jgi:hypothetical protein
MNTAIKMYAVETPVLFGRGFSLTEYALENGHEYNGIMLFREEKLAQEEIDDELSFRVDSLEEDSLELSVEPVFVHPNGNITDVAGFSINKNLALQNNQNEDQVAAHMAAFFKNEKSLHQGHTL